MDNETLRRLFEYEPDTGLLRRVEGGKKPYPWRSISKGYLACTVAGVTYYLHRLVYQWHNGFTPAMVDHVNGDPKDCRIENLRACTAAENQYNSRRKSNNRSGFKGVAYQKGYRLPWRARIIVDKQPVLLGRFSTPEEAHEAYIAGAAKYAKEFARTK